MSELLHAILQLLNEMANFHHSEDMRAFTSLLLFITSFAAANIFLYDIFRGKRRKIAGSKWHKAFVSMSFVFFTLSVFAAARLLDSMADMVFILDNPHALTTLSQRSLILDIPVIGVSITIIITLIFAIRTYLKIPPPNNGD